MQSNVQIVGNTLQIVFDRWTPENYQLFLKCKKLPEYHLDYNHEADSYLLRTHARFASIISPQMTFQPSSGLPFAEHLFDYQRYFAGVALDAERFAVWADTGLGKTNIGLEFARQVAARTSGRVLIITPLNILEQWRDEARRWFGLELDRIESREHLRQWCAAGDDGRVGIVNPDKFIPRAGENQKINECNRLAGVVLDESSLLKSGGGTIKWALIHSCKGVQCKLSLTATPAPNDTMEYASQGSFLEKLVSEGDILWTYFTRTKDGGYVVKDHAREAFYRFMSSWSVYLRNPARYGFADNLKDLPAPEVYEHEVKPTPEQMRQVSSLPGAAGQLQFWRGEKLGVVDRSRFNQLAKGFLYGDGRRAERIPSNKPDTVADLVTGDSFCGHQVLVWTLFDEETEILAELLKPRVKNLQILTGKVKKTDRPAIIEDFRKGNCPVLITRARMLGYGLNFQNCTSMVFSGFDDSFEAMYQAIRRAYRYGQTKSVRVHIPVIRELEGAIWQNVRRSRQRSSAMPRLWRIAISGR